MAGPLHANLTGADIHVPFAFTYANAAARLAATGFVAGDVGKFAKQTDNNTLWFLIATTPTWVLIGNVTTRYEPIVGINITVTNALTLPAIVLPTGPNNESLTFTFTKFAGENMTTPPSGGTATMDAKKNGTAITSGPLTWADGVSAATTLTSFSTTTAVSGDTITFVTGANCHGATGMQYSLAMNAGVF